MKIRKIKQIGVAILSVIMLLSLNLTEVLALTDATGRDHDKDVSLTIYKYETDDELFKGFEADGTQQNMPDIAKPIPGVTFKIESVTLKSTAAVGSNDPNDYEPASPAFSTTGITNGAGKIVFSTDSNDNTAENVLPGQGIYKISEINSVNPGTKYIADFIVSLPMANPSSEENADPWLYDVYAYPKNDVKTPIVKEIVPGETGGNIINWRYSVIVPEDITTPLTGKESLVITDKLDYRLSYVTGSIKGTYITKGSTVEVDLIENTDYTLVTGTGTDDSGKPIQVLTITVTPDGFAKLGAALTVSGDETPMLYFSFDTKINIGSEDADLETIYNGGELDYTNSADHKYEKEKIEEPDKPDTEIYGIKIYKINVNGETLEGASFKIYTSEADAKSGSNALISPNGTDVWTVTTAQNGYAYFYGLVEGTYYLVETDAPTGYNKLKNPIEVVVSVETVDIDHTVQVTVTNSKGFTLPVTGGMGTILFTAGGLLLIGMAAILLFFAKRKKTKKK